MMTSVRELLSVNSSACTYMYIGHLLFEKKQQDLIAYIIAYITSILALEGSYVTYTLVLLLY